MKKAQSMGINVVIVAAIALLVLIVITVIVARGGIGLSRGVDSCEAKGGQCTSGGSPDPLDPRWVPGEGTCQGSGQCYVYNYG